jgi:hypothetical protein
LANVGINAVLRPGVDGDLVGLLSSSESYEDAVLASVFEVAASSGRTCTIVSEGGFGDALAHGATGHTTPRHAADHRDHSATILALSTFVLRCSVFQRVSTSSR